MLGAARNEEENSRKLEKLLNMREVAEILGIGQTLAWQLVWDGKLTSVRVGRFIRVRPADIEKFLDENQQLPGDFSATPSAIRA